MNVFKCSVYVYTHIYFDFLHAREYMQRYVLIFVAVFALEGYVYMRLYARSTCIVIQAFIHSNSLINIARHICVSMHAVMYIHAFINFYRVSVMYVGVRNFVRIYYMHIYALISTHSHSLTLFPCFRLGKSRWLQHSGNQPLELRCVEIRIHSDLPPSPIAQHI